MCTHGTYPQCFFWGEKLISVAHSVYMINVLKEKTYPEC